MSITEQARSYIEQEQTRLKPREMVRVTPQRLNVFESLLETPTQPSKVVGARALTENTLFGTLLRPSLNLTVAQHYVQNKEPQQIIVKESKDITITQEIVGKRTDTHLVLVVEEGVQTNIHFELGKKTPEGLHDMYIELLVKKGAKVTFTTLQNAPNTTAVRLYRAAKVEENAKLEHHDILIGSEYQELHSEISLAEIGAAGNQTATLFGNEQRFLLTQQSRHLVGETTSDIATKAVLGNHSHAGFKGLVAIAPGASESEGYQQMDVLLLDDTSRATAIPELAIQTDIVSCSHGATIGELDENQLFYLQARGLSKREATHLLLVGFLSEGIKHLPEEKQNTILQQVEQRL